MSTNHLNRDALIIGICQYDELPMSAQLETLAKQAEQLAQLLETQGGFKVTRLPCAADLTLSLNERVKWPELEKAIEKLLYPPAESPTQTALLFFAGHGLVKETKLGKEGFLATSEADNRSVYGFSLKTLRDLLRHSPIKQQIVFLESCHSGEFFTHFQADEKRDYCFITSARAHEEALTQGLLTNALLETLDYTHQPKDTPWVNSDTLIEKLQQQLTTTEGWQRFEMQTQGHLILTNRAFSQDFDPNAKPYKGLHYFDNKPEDALFFKGRETLIAELLAKVKAKPFLAVLGASGNGKSSVVRAGVLYQLQQTGTCEIVKPFTPTATPLTALTNGLGTTEIVALVNASAKARVLLTIDQFEEVFSLCQDPQARDTFFNTLLDAVEQAGEKLCLIVVMRADFMDKCSQYPRLARYFQDHQHIVTRPTEAEIQQIIEAPAKQAGFLVEPRLVAEMVTDFKDSLGGLPLLEFALTTLWEKGKADRLLRYADYQALGRIQGILEKKATETYEKTLTPAEQVVAKRVFLELTELGEGRHDTRRLVPQTDLLGLTTTQTSVEQVIAKLVKEHLIVTDQTTVTVVNIAHDALIEHWSVLRQWLDQSREDLKLQRQINEGAKAWKAGKKALLVGVDLARAEEYLGTHLERVLLSEIGIEFVKASVALREKEVQEREQQRRERERLQRRNLRVLAASFVIAVVLGLFGWWQWGEAGKQRDHAQQNEKKAIYQAATSKAEAQAIDASAQSQAGTGEISALLVAMQAGQDLRKLVKDNGIQNLADYPTVRPLLSLQTILNNISEANQFPVGEGEYQPQFVMDVSPDGKLVAIGDTAGKLQLFDLAGHEVAKWQVYPKDKAEKREVKKVQFSPDGKWMVTCTYINGRMSGRNSYFYLYHIWNTSGKQVAEINGGSDSHLPDINFSPDGQHLVGIMSEKDFEASVVQIWDLSGQKIAQIAFNPAKTKYNRDTREKPESVETVDYTPDGKQLVIGSDQGEVQIYDLVQQRKILQFQAYGEHVARLDVSPDGQHILTMGMEKTQYQPKIAGRYMTLVVGHVKLWDMTGKLIAELETAINIGGFSPDGQRIVTMGDVVETWDLSGKRLKQLKGHFGATLTGRFSPDGQQIITVGLGDNTLRFWNLTSPPMVQLPTYPDQNSWAFSRDNQRMIVTSGVNDNVRVYDLSSGQPTDVNQGDPNIPLTLTRPTPDGSGFVKFEEIPVPDEKSQTYKMFKDRPDQYPRTAKVDLYDWSGKLITELKTSEVVEGYGVVYFLLSRRGLGETSENAENDTFSVSNDGRTVATLGLEEARIWDLSNQRVIRLKDPQELFVDKFWKVLVSPDGKYVSTIGKESPIRRLWDTSSGNPVASFMRGGVLQEGEGTGAVPFDLYRNKRIVVFEDSPAMKAGLKEGDLIKKVDGKEMMSTDSLKCNAGEQKILQVERRSGELADKIETLEFVVTCGKFSLRGPRFEEFAQFTPNSQYVVTWNSAEKFVRLWNLKGEVVTDKIVGKNQVQGVFPSCDSQFIGTIDSLGLMEIWDLAGNKLSELPGQHGHSEFSCDNQRIATSGTGTDKKIRIWDVKGRQLAEFDNFEFLGRFAFTPNGQNLEAFAKTAAGTTVMSFLPITGLNELLGQGCYWLKDYLASHPAVQSQLTICQDPSILAEATKQSTKIAEVERINVNFHLEQRKLQAAIGDYPLAMEELRMAVKSDPSLKFEELKTETGKIAVKALLEAAKISMENGDYKQGVAKYTQAQIIDPNEVSFGRWGVVCWSGILNNYVADVMVACENAIAMKGGDGIRGARGIAKAIMGDKAGALEDFEAFIHLVNQLKSGTTEQDQLLVEVLILQWQHWVEQLKNGENPFTRANLAILKEGSKALNIGMGIDPYYVGQVGENHKDLEGALSFYKKVTGGSNRLPAQKRVAWILTEQGKLEEALEYLRYIPYHKEWLLHDDLDDLRTESKKNEYFRNLIQFELDLITQHQRSEEAMKFYNRLLKDKDKLYGEETRILFKRALLADQMKHSEAFKQDIQQVLLELEDDTNELASLGWLLYQLGKSSESLDYLRKAQAKQTSNTPPEVAVETATHLGEVLWASGQLEEAKTIWKKALKNFPDNQPLREVVKKFWPDFERK